MTLKLIIIRHAKSSWGDPFAEDHDRVLNERGRASAGAIGDWLAAKGHLPDVALCSTAARTVETLDLLSARLPQRPQITYRRPLYHASASTILAELQAATAGVVALVGHNPGIGSFACGMVAERPDHPDFGRYPTAATTVIEFAGPEWKNARPQTGRVLDFIVPRELLA